MSTPVQYSASDILSYWTSKKFQGSKISPKKMRIFGRLNILRYKKDCTVFENFLINIKNNI